jgi:hypothetical protein
MRLRSRWMRATSSRDARGNGNPIAVIGVRVLPFARL